MNNREWLLTFLLVATGLLALVLITACQTDPSQWRPADHAAMARNCRVACHPGRMTRYDSMDGSCECAAVIRSR